MKFTERELEIANTIQNEQIKNRVSTKLPPMAIDTIAEIVHCIEEFDGYNLTIDPIIQLKRSQLNEN